MDWFLYDIGLRHERVKYFIKEEKNHVGWLMHPTTIMHVGFV